MVFVDITQIRTEIIQNRTESQILRPKMSKFSNTFQKNDHPETQNVQIVQYIQKNDHPETQNVQILQYIFKK